ncbi:hypothetical protein V5799_025944 [Amblyomma americanum]|uniref:Uncharacterized protein n=1 Tax=Amblyomma americanum TaxID=6943 RepID=A0AAQ4DJZ8_AMBAM
MCPLDREPFEEDECHRIPIPARKANNLKAHCWNEEHGCEFVGTMEAVLRHYEEECTFQTIECRRCAERVLHKDLAVHYLGGCLPDTPSASTEQPSTQGSVLTVHDVSTALEDLKVLLKDPYHEQLPAIQSQINELVEHTRSEQAELLDSIALKLRDWERNMKDQSYTAPRYLLTKISSLKEAAAAQL